MKHHGGIVRSLILGVLFAPLASHAGLIDCGFATINHVYVNGARDDATYSNQLLVELSAPCNGQSLAYIENSSPAYNSLLSMALMAFSTGVQVRVYVNESKTNQIALMEMKK